MSKGVLVVVSGFSGVGKGTIDERPYGRNMTIMHCLYLLPPETQDLARRMAESIFFVPQKNLKQMIVRTS